MSLKGRFARWFVEWTDSWNHELHNAIELKVIKAYTDSFAPDAPDRDDKIKEMRVFYYTRFSSTASLLVTVVSVIVAVIALIVSLIALHHSG